MITTEQRAALLWTGQSVSPVDGHATATELARAQAAPKALEASGPCCTSGPVCICGDPTGKKFGATIKAAYANQMPSSIAAATLSLFSALSENESNICSRDMLLAAWACQKS